MNGGPMAGGAGSRTAGVLVVTADAALGEEVDRCAAGVGATTQRVKDVSAALARWSVAGLVLVGDDLAASLVATGPPRRDHVHLVARSPAREATLRAAVLLGVRSVVEVPAPDDRLARLMGAVADPRPPGTVVALTGGSGGVGASLLAAAVATLAARDATVLLVDVDVAAAGPDLLVGREQGAGLHWEELLRTGGRVAPSALREGVPRHDGLGLLGWAAPPGLREAPPVSVLREVLEAARQSHDLVVVDLPRTAGAGDPGGVVDQVVARADRVWLVVRPSVTGLAAAAGRASTLGSRVGVVVRGRGADDRVVTRSVGHPVVAHLAHDPRVDERVDLGLGPVASARGRKARGRTGRAAVTLLADLAQQGRVPR